jgi:two-component system, OmpR family, sensor kinase
MPDQVWYRSLYWRIAIGFVALLAVLLLAQAVIFLWLTDRMIGTPSRTPSELAEFVAGELAPALEVDPALDLPRHVRQQFGRIFQPFLVLLDDGRSGSNRPGGLPPNLEARTRMQLARRDIAPLPRAFPEVRGPMPESLEELAARGSRGGPGRGASGRGALAAGGSVFAPIVVNGQVRGLVAVPGAPPPFSIALNELGPTLTWLGLLLLGLGATVTALLIFRPAHTRLRALEQAARALGEGRTDVRALEGGDEVGSLARTFNAMAGDLETRARALEEADRDRRQLLADVSHELMTPLTAIRGYAETLAMGHVPMDDAARQRYVGIVLQETNRLEAIIGDLLDLARLEGGGDSLTLEAVPVAHLFGRVRDRHDPVVRERGITLAFEIAADVLSIHGDEGRLEQALQNIAANAIRHTPQGGTVTLRAAAEDDEVLISVHDTGPGIPPEHLPRVFDRFYKVDAARTGTAVPSGSGLGLSIVRAIVERHGGSVRATNAPEGGAVFELRLPSARAR